MSEFKNKRLHLSIIDGVFIVVFICLSIISAYFWSEYTETKDLYNIEKTNVDFIITAPSKEQVSEIEDQSHIDKVVPYVYKTITIDSNNKAISANLYIIENTCIKQEFIFGWCRYRELNLELTLTKGL